VISTFLKANDDMIIPRHANPNHALMRVGNDGNSILHVKVGSRYGSYPVTHAAHSWLGNGNFEFSNSGTEAVPPG
jgi:hypothetical protein